MNPIRFEDNIGLVHLQAKQGFKWAQGSGLSLDYEDMFQEASEAFVIAANGFDPDAGVKFSAYYTKVCFSHFRRTIGVMTGVKNLNEGQREEIAARKAENARRAAAAEAPLPNMNYGLAPVMFSDLAAGDEEGFAPFEESLPSSTVTPEEALIAKDLWEKKSANLSPLAQLVVEWLKDPPEALVQEVRAQLAHAEIANEEGVKLYGYRDGISISNIGQFLQMASQEITARQIANVKRELLAVVEEIEQEEVE